jgi:hypothetical protein
MPLRLFKFLSCVILVVSCVACASARLAKPEQDVAAKQFQVPAGEANIYIYRNENIVFNNEIPVEINGKHAGNTNKETFILKSVAPGKHTITAFAENTETIEITTAVDNNYFIWLEVKIGAITNHAHFHLVDEAQGKSGVRECKLIE